MHINQFLLSIAYRDLIILFGKKFFSKNPHRKKNFFLILYMLFLQNRNSFKANKISMKEDRTISTLLVPDNLIPALLIKVKEHGNLVGYFSYLLSQYKILSASGMFPPPRKIKTEYQNENLSLKRINFRVKNSDWIEIGQLALAYGKSRCYIFTFLLELDLLGAGENLSEFEFDQVVPTPNRLLQRATIYLKKFHYDFRRIYYVRI